jgi:hypothetical protein
MTQPTEEIFREQPVDIESLRQEVKDDIPATIKEVIKKHNEMLTFINKYEEEIDSLTPFQLSKLQYYYNKAEREAWKLAGYFKSQYQYYFGKASTERGQFYIYERETNKVAVNDSNYRSKVQEGINQEISGIYEGHFVTWRGIAQSYAGAMLTMKDMIKAIEKEGG